MKFSGLSTRLAPLRLKLQGKLPLCPWPSVVSSLDPRTLSAYPPPARIEVVEELDTYKKLRFNGVHEAWFPVQTEITPEMWSEYLAVFWEHRANPHRYLAHGTLVRPGDVCLDCGSCEGFFAFQALEAGAAKVICIEPNPEMADCVRRTFARQIAEGKVIVRSVAVGAIDGQTSFTSDQLSPFGGAVEVNARATIVTVETIARLCAELALERVDFVKMDIEGAELQAVEGALPILRRDHPRLAITTYHRSFHFAALHTLLLAAGYREITAAGWTDRHGRTIRPVMLHAWS